MPDDKRLATRGTDRWLGRSDGTVKVPSTYQSDDGPALDLNEMRVRLGKSAGFYGEVSRKDREGRNLPYRLELSIDCNGEAAKRLAAFFGLYDPEAWNREARLHGLPEVPAAPQLPPKEVYEAARQLPPGDAEDDAPEGGPSDLDPCPCGHRREHHDYEGGVRVGICTRLGCACLGFGFHLG